MCKLCYLCSQDNNGNFFSNITFKTSTINHYSIWQDSLFDLNDYIHSNQGWL